MKSATQSARIFLFSVTFVGALAFAWNLTQLTTFTEPLLLVLMALLAATAHLLRNDHPASRGSSNLALVPIAFTLLYFGYPYAVLVIACGYLVGLLRHLEPLFLTAFHLARAVIITTLTGLTLNLISPPPFQGTLTTMVAALGILFLSIVAARLINAVLWQLFRRKNFLTSGTFRPTTIGIDVALLALGGSAALVWQIDPLFLPIFLAPVYLVYIARRHLPDDQNEVDIRTGLLKSRPFLKVLHSEIARAVRFDRPLVILLADLDLLRDLNSTYGRIAGDEVLNEVAAILRDSIRNYDTIARLGDEEFVVLMPETDAHEAYRVAERIRQQIADHRFEVSTNAAPIKATVSVGIAALAPPAESAEMLIHHASRALYWAKSAGRNTSRIYSPNGPDTDSPTPLPARLQLDDEDDPVSGPTADSAAPRPADARSAPASAPAPRPPWLITAYVAGLALIATGLVVWQFEVPYNLNWWALALYLGITILTEAFSIDIYAKGTSISTSAAIIIAGALAFGPIGATLIGLTQALTTGIKNRSPLNRFVFNASNQIIAGMAVYALEAMTGSPIFAWPALIQLLLTGLAGILVFFSTSTLVSLAIDFSTGTPALYIWNQNFRWLGTYYGGLALVAFALNFALERTGWVGVLVVLGPLFLLRISQVQYVSHMQDAVRELRRANEALVSTNNQVEQLNEELLLALAEATDMRDPYVAGHSAEVARYAVLIAQALELSDEVIDRVRRGGLLHDIGKLGIPEAILFKPAQLTDSEYNIVKRHANLGGRILQRLPSLRPLQMAVRHHHERYDGMGYPSGLFGRDIPIEARILAVADAVEAMASDRPYRRAMSASAILNEIHRHTGSQFDPEIVTAFEGVIARHGPSVIVNSARAVIARSDDEDLSG